MTCHIRAVATACPAASGTTTTPCSCPPQQQAGASPLRSCYFDGSAPRARNLGSLGPLPGPCAHASAHSLVAVRRSPLPDAKKKEQALLPDNEASQFPASKLPQTSERLLDCADCAKTATQAFTIERRATAPCCISAWCTVSSAPRCGRAWPVPPLIITRFFGEARQGRLLPSLRTQPSLLGRLWWGQAACQRGRCEAIALSEHAQITAQACICMLSHCTPHCTPRCLLRCDGVTAKCLDNMCSHGGHKRLEPRTLYLRVGLSCTRGLVWCDDGDGVQTEATGMIAASA
jgi:hypothetical protein